jgi:hypothetical protein
MINSSFPSKGNAIYNILPDAISTLSSSERVSTDSFEQIMKYLFSLIDKAKQSENLTEKLCHRFNGTDGTRTPKQHNEHELTVQIFSFSLLSRCATMEKHRILLITAEPQRQIHQKIV